MVFTILALAIAMLLESLAPRRKLAQGLLFRWANNFSLAAVTWYTSVLVASAFTLYLVGIADTQGFGLMKYLEAGPVASFIVYLLVTQFISYISHVLFHKVSWLWPIHALHHSDVDVDVSTTYRHHPIEPLVFLPVSAPIVMMLGVPLEVAAVYKIFEIAIQVLSHSNIRLPESVDRVLRLFILTPDFHRLHHCSENRFTDSNYGSVLPLFDYLFGTASKRPFDEQESMETGLEYLREPADSRLDRMLMLPFRWRALTRAFKPTYR